jgi:histidine triad (HIT) family protein
MTDCIFCAIERGEAPASLIYQDDRAIVLLDLFPVREGHALIIPRTHAGYLEELDDGLAAHLFNLARRVIIAQKRAGLSVRAHNLVVNDGREANQHVPHVHLHVVPRQGGDTLATALTWGTRMLNVFGREKRRARLDRLAAMLAEHFPAD